MKTLRNASVIAAVAATILNAPAARAVPAFPGADGFGAQATGGRGGDVYHVTTLADDPNHVIRGSLFYGLYEKAVPGSGTTTGVGRTIVFDVGGTINLGATTLDLKNIKNVTVAGHTAPSPVTIIGNTVQITSSSGKETGNIILQHIAIRKGLASSGDALSIKGSGNTHDILVDHVSGSWSEDEVISVGGATNHATNVTVQYSTMSEALTSGHQYGALVRNNQNARVSYLHNLFSNNASRNPRPGTYLGTTLDFEFQNNVIYNWSDRAGYTGGASETDTENVNMNYVGNYLIAGPSTVGGPTIPGGVPVTGAKRNTAFTKDASGDPLNLNVYQSGNKIDWSSGATRDGQDTGWGMFANWNGTTSSAFPAADQEPARFAYPASATDSADVAYGKVISSVGAMPWARTPTDQRLVNEVLGYGGMAAQAAPNTTEWNALVTAASPANWTTRPATYDEEDNGFYPKVSWEDPAAPTNQPRPKGDGMPTWWENLRGYNALVSDNNVVESDGYTRLEHYLREVGLTAVWNTNADANWSDHLNWRGTRPVAQDSTANFGAAITAPRTIQVDLPISVGRMSFNSAHGYALAGAGPMTIDVFAGRATIDVQNGSHAINVPITLADDTIITCAASSGITLNNLQPSAGTITKAGPGGLAVNGVRAASLNVTGGVVVVIPNGSATGTSVINNLSISTGAALDLGNNDLVVNNGSFTTIRDLVIQGFVNLGGITSSTSDGSQILALFDNAIVGADTWNGLSIGASAIVGKYTYMGDVNLDGVVSGDDYTVIDANLGMTPAPGVAWLSGDANLDGVVSGDDYTVIDANLGLGTANPLTPNATAVPEPSSAAAGFATWLLVQAFRRLPRRGDIAAGRVNTETMASAR